MRKTIIKKNKNKRKGSYNLNRNNIYSNFENISRTFLDPHKYVTLCYEEEFTLSMATTVGNQQTMNLNSIFDPNRTGTGHQPYGFDQLAALYNRYRVLAVHYKCVFATGTNTYHVVVLPVNGLINTSITDQASFQTVAESPRASSHIYAGGSPSLTVSRLIHLNDLTGVTPTEYLADDRFEAAISTSPTELMTLVIGTYNSFTSTVIAFVSVKLKFMVDFHDPISLAGS